MPRNRRGRELDAIVLLDKPQGLSSNQALQRARRLFDARKAGHTGSLDPLATGMLPVCFGQATKICGLLLASAKTYEVTAQFGVATDTGDADGQVIARAAIPAFDAERMAQVLAGFRGPIQQVPPMYSALKHEGQRLYALARAGQVVVRPPREVVIQELTVLASDATLLALRVHCSKGTYIRTLVEDIAAALGTVAHVTALRRVWVEPFQALPMYSLEALEALDMAGREAVLLPTDRGLVGLARVGVPAPSAQRLTEGVGVPCPAGPGAGELLRVYAQPGGFVGLARRDALGQLRPERMFPGLQPAGGACGGESC